MERVNFMDTPNLTDLTESGFIFYDECVAEFHEIAAKQLYYMKLARDREHQSPLRVTRMGWMFYF